MPKMVSDLPEAVRIIINSLTNIIETQKQMKKSTFILFVDFNKAFDKINRESLWSKLKQMGVPENMVNSLQCIYSRVQCCVRLNGISSNY